MIGRGSNKRTAAEAGQDESPAWPSKVHELAVDGNLLRLGGAAAIAGQLLLVGASVFHPSREHPADHPAVFAEYAESASWTTVHLVQWLGGVLMFVAVALLASHLRRSHLQAAVLSRIAFGAAITVTAIFTALQAVDGISLKMAVDAWVAAAPERRAAVFSAAEAIRWTEIGLNAVGRIFQGVAISAVALAAAIVGLHGRMLAGLGLLAGIGGAAGGVATAYTGFSTFSAAIGMAPLILQIVWVIGTGIVMWRRGSTGTVHMTATDRYGRGVAPAH